MVVVSLMKYYPHSFKNDKYSLTDKFVKKNTEQYENTDYKYVIMSICMYINEQILSSDKHLKQNIFSAELFKFKNRFKSISSEI